MAKKSVPTFAYSFNRSQDLDYVEQALVVKDEYGVPNLSTATTMIVTAKGTVVHQCITKVLRNAKQNNVAAPIGTTFINLPLMAAFVALTNDDYHVYLKTGKASAICLTLLHSDHSRPANEANGEVAFEKEHFKAKTRVVPVPLEIALSAGPAGPKSLFDFDNEGSVDSVFPMTLAPSSPTTKKADRRMKKAEKKAQRATRKLTPERVA